MMEPNDRSRRPPAVSGHAPWIVSLLLVGVIVYLVVLDARTLTVKSHAPVALDNTAPAYATKTAPGATTEQRTTLLLEPAAPAPVPSPQSPSAVLPAPALAPAPPAAPALQPPPATAPAPVSGSIDVIAPREGITGNSLEVRVGVQGSQVERRAQIVLEYDANTLRVLQPEPEEPGRVEATLHNTAAGKGLGLVAFRFEVIVGEKQPTALMVSATTFDAAGNTIRVLPSTQKEIMLRP